MRHKKTPVMLVVGLVVIVGVVAFMNASKFNAGDVARKRQMAEMEKQQGEKETSVRIRETASSMRPQPVNKADRDNMIAGATTPSGGDSAANLPANPVIFIPKMQRHDPVMGDGGDAGSRWWKDESGMKARGDEVREGQGRD